MYFDFEDRRPDTPLLDRPLTRLEQILLTIIAYLLIVIGLIVYPKLPFVKAAEAARLEKLEQERKRMEDLRRQEPMVYAFAMPKIERQRIPERPKVLSDESHTAQSPEKAPNPKNDAPFNRQLAEPIPSAPREEPRGTEQPQPTAPAASNPNALALPTTPDATMVRNEPSPNPTLPNRSTGLLTDAIKNVGKYSQGATLQNMQGNGDFGPSFQFDSKGVDFGSWLRRFRAQVYRNWLIPYAAMTAKGHVVVTFNVHKNGSITDLSVVGPSGVGAFNSAAYGALASSNPTAPLPPEYPADEAFFTVTFFYNEEPK